MVVLNQMGMAKRPEIKPADFAEAIQLEPAACIAFEPKLFGTAANKGQMIADVAARSAAPFAVLADALLERSGFKRKAGKSGGIFSKLSSRKRSA